MTDSLGVFRIKDREFAIKEANVYAWLRDGALDWTVSVVAHDACYDNETWSPNVRIEEYRSPARSIAEFFSTPLEIADGEEFCDGKMLPGGTQCFLYVWEHTFLRDVRITFRQDAAGLRRLTWAAECDVHWSDEYSSNLPLYIDSEFEFSGFGVDADNEAECRALFAGKFDLAGMKYHEESDRCSRFFVPE